MKSTLFFTSLITLMLISTTNQAAIIVDSGAADRPGGSVLDNRQWLAKEFSLNNKYNITGVEGYISTNVLSNIGGTFSISIYSNGGNIPGIELFSTEATSTFGESFNHWQGTHDLDWNLSSGNYWMTFEVREGQTFFGTMTNSNDFDLSLESEAYWKEIEGGWNPTTFSIGGKGIRIYGDVSPIPLPPAVILFSTGFLLLFGFIKKQSF